MHYKGGKRLDILLFLVMSSAWALNYSFLKIALRFEPPMVTLLFRMIFAVIFSIPFSYSSIRHFRDIGIVRLFVMSLLNVTLFMALWFIGEQTEPSNLSSILIYTYPIFSVLLSGVLLKENLTRGRLIGLVIGFLGVVVIFYNELTVNLGVGLFLLLGASMSWAIGTVFYKKYLKEADMGTVNSFQFIFALPPILAAAIFYGGYRPLVTSFILITIYMGSIGSSVAYFIYWGLIRKYKVSHVSPYLFTVPALSILFSMLINSEMATPLILAGFAMIAIGIFVSSR